MVKVHKRKKNSRIRGSRTAGWGFRQSHKGHGNKGGVGMAGTGKKADHKKQKAKNLDKKKKYFGKQGFTSRGTKRDKGLRINLSDIKSNLLKKGTDKIDLSKYVILGNGEGFKCEIIALRASKSAIEKMTKAGGKITIVEKKKKETTEPKKDEKKSSSKKAEKKSTSKKVEKKDK